MNYKEIKADVVIIGGGGAALSAAINVGKDLDTLILDKGQVGKSGCSPNAHGGLAVHYKDPNDGPEIHFEDTLLSGGFLNNQDLVRILVQNTSEIVPMLERYGALFDRDEHGNLLVRRFGGHRYARSVFCGDETGHEMMNGLRREVYRLGIRYIDEAFVTRLLHDENGEIAGVFFYYLPTGEFYVVKSKAVVLATADAAGLWPAASERQRGDGIYMALMAGAEIADIEFIQYHPTHAWWPPGVRGSVSEAFRGEGGWLLNSKGERFMKRYDPENMELATRDKVSVSIMMEIRAGRGAPHGGIFASVTHLPAKYVKKRLPVIYQKYKNFGIDITKEPIEVRPRPHYLCGGVVIDENAATKVPGLFAGGAVTAGVHGANRLGSNALTDIIVFGKIAGKNAGEFARSREYHSPNKNEIEEEIKRIKEIFDKPWGEDSISIGKVRRELIELMDRDVGVIRNETGLKDAIEKLNYIKHEIAPRVTLRDKSKTFNFEVKDILELPFRIELGIASATAALMRKESRGTHFREDYPHRDDENWLKNIVFFLKDGELKVETREVELKYKKPTDFPEYAKSRSPWH